MLVMFQMMYFVSICSFFKGVNPNISIFRAGRTCRSKFLLIVTNKT